MKTLYPLQDKALREIGRLPVNFYLTGGTAISRCLLHHRYSDDLDFFLNSSPEFAKEAQIVIDSISKNFETKIGLQSDSFQRLFLTENNAVLKLEFINDVGFHSGGYLSHELYPKIDNPLNILSNKMSALQRNQAKDVADIIYISLNYDFDWVEIFEDVEKKDNWMNELLAVQYLNDFDPEQFKLVHWKHSVDFQVLKEHCITIAIDIIKGKRNSLYKPK